MSGFEFESRATFYRRPAQAVVRGRDLGWHVMRHVQQHGCHTTLPRSVLHAHGTLAQAHRVLAQSRVASPRPRYARLACCDSYVCGLSYHGPYRTAQPQAACSARRRRPRPNRKRNAGCERAEGAA
jgi:hypothetical protein